MDVAARVLAAAIPGAHPPESVRTTGRPPTAVAAATASLVDATDGVVAELRDDVGDGTVAVICPASLREVLAPVGGGLPADESEALDRAVTVLAVDVVKGLEFDAVVVVEPARLVREADNGMQALYVALTRATKRLVLVHTEPLPAVLGAL
jgi:DNA helicase IV